ncbi:NAD(P)/FAD-dependent oxidoreductase [Paraoerskovia marina]|uniref:NAD(P)/FAD-dependent oxidoreductase n=1 Tax=Paraoerskovia marina TaxID=545619 RepID=UPI000AD17463|nr:FAD-dependent oxidoreductase [Paraoerskovia marina]
MSPSAPETLPPHRLDSLLVVGAGLAGAQTVAALRGRGFTGEITLIGAEEVEPYDRPPLSKELLSRPEPAWLQDELGVDVHGGATVHLGETVEALTLSDDDVRVSTSAGRSVAADAVVLAVGSRPLRPSHWESASLLHTADDAAALRERLTPGHRLVVVGAGWIGAEVAGVAAGAGVQVTVVEAAETPLSRQLGDVGRRTVPWYEEAGVTLLTGVGVDAVSERAVHLVDGRVLDADTVLAAVGARPATGWLVGTVPVDDRGAIATDDVGRARFRGPGAGRVWAVGDCATRRDDVRGDVAGGHWSAALLDPDRTAAALLGQEVPATAAPYVFSRQLGHDVAVFGEPDAHDDVVFREGEHGWAALYLDPTDDGRTDDEGNPVHALRAVVLADVPREISGVRKILGAAATPDVVVSRATDPSVRWRDAVAR